MVINCLSQNSLLFIVQSSSSGAAATAAIKIARRPENEGKLIAVLFFYSLRNQRGLGTSLQHSVLLEFLKTSYNECLEILLEEDMNFNARVTSLSARFLLAKLNPSATHNSAHDAVPASDVIFTDHVSLQVFFEHLQRLVAQSR